MNYYALLLIFKGKNLSIYNPETGEINRIKQFDTFPPSSFFVVNRLFSCRQLIEQIYYHFPIRDQPDYRIVVVTPTDPEWKGIYAYRHPPLHPGGPPAASEEDLDSRDDQAAKVIYAIETKQFRKTGDR